MASIIDKHGNIAFFGRLSWGNFFDWLVTLCLGGIIMLTTLALGGVRPDTHLTLLPLFAGLLALHGLWLALDNESPKRLSQVPLFFVPGLLWMLCSVLWLSPVPWRGWHEMVYALEVFIVLWVLANNVRTRAHLWLLILMALAPSVVAIFNGFYQFFQDPGRMAGAMTDYRVEIDPEFLGRATGSFADPNAFAAFLLILLPFLLIAAAVPRLPKILRVLAFYIALMFLGAVAFTQSYWAAAMVVLLLALVPWFCFRALKRRVLFSSPWACSRPVRFSSAWWRSTRCSKRGWPAPFRRRARGCASCSGGRHWPWPPSTPSPGWGRAPTAPASSRARAWLWPMPRSPRITTTSSS